jgi:hypothetical protein
MAAEPIKISDPAVAAALAALRVEFAEWGVQEFPLSGFDCLRQMNIVGLCTQEEADAAIKAAGEKRDVSLPTADEVRGLFRDDMADERPF